MKQQGADHGSAEIVEWIAKEKRPVLMGTLFPCLLRAGEQSVAPEGSPNRLTSVRSDVIETIQFGGLMAF
jgi:hypothetical protein